MATFAGCNEQRTMFSKQSLTCRQEPVLLVDFSFFNIGNMVNEWNSEHSDEERQHSHKQQEAESVRLIGAKIYAGG